MKAMILSMTLIAVAACGGTAVGPNPGQSTACTVTLSGAVTGTLSTCVAVGSYSTTNSLSTLGITATNNTIGTVSVAIIFPGNIGNTNIKATDTGAMGGVTFSGPGGSSIWLATPAQSGSAAQGTYAADVTGETSYAAANGSTAYFVHGTFNATLVPPSGSSGSGNVTLAITY